MKKIKAGAGNNRGFTLLELSVALAGLAIITTAAIPYFIRQAEVAAAQRTTKEVSSIEEAAKWYRVQNSVWPTSVAALQSAGYLNPSWTVQNPWGNAYSISSNATSLTVTTTLPDSMGGILSRGLPGISSTTVGTNRTVNSVIPVPGQEASLTGVTNLANSAQSAANSAQSSANSAQSTASSAQSTANSALSLAQASAVPPYGTIGDGILLYGSPGGNNQDPFEFRCPTGYAVVGATGNWAYLQGITCQRIAR